MEKANNQNKTIVYWGIGNICKYCLKLHPEINPSFFIDSKFGNKNIGNKVVKFPNEISDWTQYYIVITIKSSKVEREIQQYLEKKGLCKNINFSTYKEFFECEDITIQTGLDLVAAYISKHSKIVNPIMLILPFESIRNRQVLSVFLSAYFNKRGNDRCFVFSHLKVINSKELSSEFKCVAFGVPEMDKNNISQEEYDQIKNEISEEEFNWLKKLESILSSNVLGSRIYESIEIYYYYKMVIEMINPSKIIIWGSWKRENYILEYLAKHYNVPYGYMEYGWLPGTYQVDPRGIAGQSEYAVNPEMFEKLDFEDIYDIEGVKQYVRDYKLDTRIFNDTKEDNAQILSICPNKKTIFFVGMGEKGIHINPKSDYWKKYVSNVVESTEEVLALLIQLCRKNNWNLIFKPHPGEPVPELKCGLEDVIIVRSMEIDRLICLADVAVSIASAVDYKVLIYGKPLVQLGITGLLGKGCTYTVSKKEMLEEQIHLALKNGMTKEQTENYNRLLQILLQRYLWDDMSDRNIRYGLSVERD